MRLSEITDHIRYTRRTAESRHVDQEVGYGAPALQHQAVHGEEGGGPGDAVGAARRVQAGDRVAAQRVLLTPEDDVTLFDPGQLWAFGQQFGIIAGWRWHPGRCLERVWSTGQLVTAVERGQVAQENADAGQVSDDEVDGTVQDATIIQTRELDPPGVSAFDFESMCA